jgi:hypothetical protein
MAIVTSALGVTAPVWASSAEVALVRQNGSDPTIARHSLDRYAASGERDASAFF